MGGEDHWACGYGRREHVRHAHTQGQRPHYQQVREDQQELQDQPEGHVDLVRMKQACAQLQDVCAAFCACVRRATQMSCAERCAWRSVGVSPRSVLYRKATAPYEAQVVRCICLCGVCGISRSELY